MIYDITKLGSCIVDKERKGEIITQFRLRENDTGSVEVQVALLTERINRLTEHLRLYPHDRHSRHALHGVIGKQRRFLAYLNRKNPEQYYSLIARLGLRK
jgi:small subunit ribosomal protein S15